MSIVAARQRLSTGIGRAAVRRLGDRVERLRVAVEEESALMAALEPEVSRLEQTVRTVLERRAAGRGGPDVGT